MKNEEILHPMQKESPHLFYKKKIREPEVVNPQTYLENMQIEFARN